MVRLLQRRKSMAIRVVRRAVETVGHAVAVAVAAPLVLGEALAVPMAVLERPAALVLHPAVRMPVHAVALMLEMAPHPHVAMAAPVPEARDPYVSRARSRHHLVARRRRGDVDVD